MQRRKTDGGETSWGAPEETQVMMAKTKAVAVGPGKKK